MVRKKRSHNLTLFVMCFIILNGLAMSSVGLTCSSLSDCYYVQLFHLLLRPALLIAFIMPSFYSMYPNFFKNKSISSYAFARISLSGLGYPLSGWSEGVKRCPTPS